MSSTAQLDHLAPTRLVVLGTRPSRAMLSIASEFAVVAESDQHQRVLPMVGSHSTIETRQYLYFVKQASLPTRVSTNSNTNVLSVLPLRSVLAADVPISASSTHTGSTKTPSTNTLRSFWLILSTRPSAVIHASTGSSTQSTRQVSLCNWHSRLIR